MRRAYMLSGSLCPREHSYSCPTSWHFTTADSFWRFPRSSSRGQVVRYSINFYDAAVSWWSRRTYTKMGKKSRPQAPYEKICHPFCGTDGLA